MKKIAALLALLLIIAGCQTAAVDTAAQPGGSSAAGSSAAASATDSSVPASDASVAGETPDGWQFDGAGSPKPETPPVETVSSIELPAELYISGAGYAVEALTPAQYDLNFPLNRGGPRGFLSCDYFQLLQDGKYAIANPNGKIVTDFAYTDVENGWYTIFGGSVVSAVKGEKEGAVSIVDGSVVVDFLYDSVIPLRGGKLLKCQKGDELLLVDYTGEVRFTFARGDEIIAMKDTLAVLQDGMLKFYGQKDFLPIKNFGADGARFGISDGRASENRVLFEVNGNWGICDGEGKVIVQPSVDEFGYFSADKEYIDFVKNGKKGIMDARGKIVCKAEWDDIKLGDGTASVCRGDRWGVITDLDSGKLGVDTVYDFVQPFQKEYAVFERNGRYGLLDREGNEVLSAKSKEIFMGKDVNLDKGYFMYGGEEPFQYGIMTTNGDVVVSDNNMLVLSPEMDKFNLIYTPQEKWGFIDRTGQIVIDAKFDNADFFLKDKNVAFVEKDGKICLIDRKGNVVLQTVFSDLIGYCPETLVCAMEYTNEQGQTKGCLVQLKLNA